MWRNHRADIVTVMHATAITCQGEASNIEETREVLETHTGAHTRDATFTFFSFGKSRVLSQCHFVPPLVVKCRRILPSRVDLVAWFVLYGALLKTTTTTKKKKGYRHDGSFHFCFVSFRWGPHSLDAGVGHTIDLSSPFCLGVNGRARLTFRERRRKEVFQLWVIESSPPRTPVRTRDEFSPMGQCQNDFFSLALVGDFQDIVFTSRPFSAHRSTSSLFPFFPRHE